MGAFHFMRLFCETAVRVVFVQGICGSLPYADLQESQQGHEND